MNANFAIAAGTVTGRDHLHSGRNNQDAFHVAACGDCSALVVCDGCGSSEHSEVGAFLGARWTATTLLQEHTRAPQWLETRDGAVGLLERVRMRLLRQLKLLARTLNGEVTSDVLFTIVGALLTPQKTLLFSLGDGLIVLNGAARQLGPFPGNQPPYLAYGLCRNGNAAPAFTLQHWLDTSAVKSLLVGTDGASDWSEIAGKQMPGRQELAGPLSQFWEDERYVRNTDAIRRRLALINRPAVLPDWSTRTIERVPALLRDDTTFIVARRMEPCCRA